MKLRKSIINLCALVFCINTVLSQEPALYDTKSYIPLLEDKKVALVVNQSSIIDDKHLVDTLIALDISIEHVFCPEHGFTGTYDAGENVPGSYYNDIPIISLYGENKKLDTMYLKNIDCVLFDLQDVGVRFYTYISTLHYVMESCAQMGVDLIVLDRPNPHAHYVDGPVLQSQYKSFVGMHPVPVVYGMTIGEYAHMINGEDWLGNNLNCELKVIKNTNYSRYDVVSFKVPPSPNLRNLNAVLLYPSLCLFEGTSVSVGRGTDNPFEIFGAPYFKYNFSFTPNPNLGSRHPKYNSELCYGVNLKNHWVNKERAIAKINLDFIINAYNEVPDDKKLNFFNNFFNLLAGNELLQQQIVNDVSELEIRKSWEEEVLHFLKVRKKYLLYN